MSVRVDIVLPCYNAAPAWAEALAEFHRQAKGLYDLRYIVVNDGSTHFSPEPPAQRLVSEEIKVKLMTYPRNRGKGFALRAGVSESEAPYILYTDIDFPFTADSTLRVIQRLVSSGADVVAGYRESEYYLMKMSMFRRQLSKSFRFFIRRVLGMAVSDTQCGLKAFNREGRKVFLATKTDRYLFDFEFIYMASREKNLKVVTEPVQLKENIVFSKMRLKVLVQETLNLFSVLVRRRSA